MKRDDDKCRKLGCPHISDRFRKENGGDTCRLICYRSGRRCSVSNPCNTCDAVHGDVPDDCPYTLELTVL